MIKLIKDFLTYTVGITIVAVFAFIVLFVMWIKEQFKYCKTCKIK